MRFNIKRKKRREKQKKLYLSLQVTSHCFRCRLITGVRVCSILDVRRLHVVRLARALLAVSILEAAQDGGGVLAGVEVGVDVERDFVEAVLLVDPLVARVADERGDLFGVLRVFLQHEVELAALDGLVRLREPVADLVDHLLDAEAVELAVVAAGVGALGRLAVVAQLVALVPDVGDGALADLAADLVLMKGRDDSNTSVCVDDDR